MLPEYTIVRREIHSPNHHGIEAPSALMGGGKIHTTALHVLELTWRDDTHEEMFRTAFTAARLLPQSPISRLIVGSQGKNGEQAIVAGQLDAREARRESVQFVTKQERDECYHRLVAVLHAIELVNFDK